MAFVDPDGFKDPDDDAGGFKDPDEGLLPSTNFKHAVPEVKNGSVVRPPEAKDERGLLTRAKDYLVGNLETGASLATGAAAFPLGTIAGALQGDTSGQVGGKMDQAIQAMTYSPRTEQGQELTHSAGQIINKIGVPLMGLHLAPKLMKSKETGAAAKAFDKTEPAPSDFPTSGPDVSSPEVMNMTKEGQGYPSSAEPFRKIQEARAAELQEPSLQPGPTPYKPYIPDNLNRLRDYREAGMEYPNVKDDGSVEPKTAGDPLALSPKLEVAVNEANGPQIRTDQLGSENLSGPMGAPPMRGQSGAIDIQGITEGLQQFRDRLKSGYSYLGTWAGAFHPQEWESAQSALFNPKSKDTIILMDPEVFHQLASPSIRPSGHAHSEIRMAMMKEEGLDTMPYLEGTVKDGVFTVDNHDGRHRMDVFKENGIQAVPVRIKANIQWGTDPIPHTLRGQTGMEYNFPEPLTLRSMPSFKKNQSGGIDTQAIGEGLAKLFKKGIPLPVTKAEMLAKQPGMGKDLEGAIPRGPKAENIIELAKQDKDGPSLWENMQSGLTLTADKVSSSLMLGTARWTQYAQKRGEFDIRQHVQPLEKAAIKLPKNQLALVQEGLKRQQTTGMPISPERLKQTGLTPEAIKVFNDFGKAYDRTFEKQNAMLEALGKKPMSKQDFYYSSVWNGDWHAPVFNNKGKLVWYIQTASRGEAKAALSYLKENFPDLNLKDVKPENRANKIDPNVPRDVVGAYQDMLQFFADDPEISGSIKAAMEDFAKEKGYGAFGQDVHFLEKQGVRGFEGDRPWQSDKKNATEGIKAQIAYLRNAYRWIPMQEALSEIKKVMSDEQLNKDQPNNMDLVKAHMARELGISPNVFKDVEQAVANMMGTSRAKMYLATNDIKTLTYLQQLGLSGGYMVATPLQGLISVPAWHLKLSGEGFRLNPFKAVKAYGLGITDAAAIVGEHYFNTYGDMLGAKERNAPMTKFGRDAKKYAEDNGIISKNLFDENSKVGEHKAVALLKDTIGSTISFPEKLVRTFSFLSFAHHLKETGKFANDEAVFQRAEELTNNALTDFRQSERPLAVDKLGVTGQLAYTYHSFLFNMFNQMGTFIRQKNYVALSSMIASLVYLGGVQDLPFVNELDGMWNIFKDFMAAQFPEHYDKVKGPGLKGSIISNLSPAAAWGHVSTALGWQMSSRFSPNMIDPERPMESLLPMAKSLGGLVPDNVPSNKNDLIQYGYNNAPAMVKGNMENYLKPFKGAKEGDVIKPNNIGSGEVKYHRDEKDRRARNWGVTSLKEADSKIKDFVNHNEARRETTARKANLDQMYSSILAGDKDVKKYVSAYLKLGGTQASIESFLKTKAEKFGMTTQEFLISHGTSLSKINEIKDRLDMEYHE